jgi:hypothetical protein
MAAANYSDKEEKGDILHMVENNLAAIYLQTNKRTTLAHW